MTETPTHTPLPWVANDQHSGANPWRIESDNGVYANDGWIIAECLGPDAEANAAFIVHAVNSHHRLIEALTDVGASLAAAISLLERGGKAAKKAAPSDRMFDQMVKDYKASLERARAALKEAGQ